MKPGLEVTPEEAQRILEERPKHPFNHTETERLRDVLVWFDEYEKAAEERQSRKENRWKRTPVIFASVGGIFGAFSGLLALWSFFFPRAH